jgi:hypothetical protein
MMLARSGPRSSFPYQGTRLAKGGIIAAALVAAALGGTAGSASADDNMDTTANAVVESGITLTALTGSFDLTGTPGATVQSVPVTYNVETNNPTGYTVTVLSASSTMDPAVPNGDSIPIADLTVRETGPGAYSAVSSTVGVPVHTQSARSANGGDNLSSEFQMRIPTVQAATYSATLNYLAAAFL